MKRKLMELCSGSVQRYFKLISYYSLNIDVVESIGILVVESNSDLGSRVFVGSLDDDFVVTHQILSGRVNCIRVHNFDAG